MSASLDQEPSFQEVIKKYASLVHEGNIEEAAKLKENNPGLNSSLVDKEITWYRKIIFDNVASSDYAGYEKLLASERQLGRTKIIITYFRAKIYQRCFTKKS